MTIEIWSDVMCPFCYIGKRKFEKALAQFPQRESVDIVWKSFQLNPNLVTDPTKNTTAHLAEAKGWTLDYAKGMTNHVVELAKQVGLNYDFDKAVVANSFDAHRFSAFAKTKGRQDAAEERLFAAYFTEGRNTADHATLIELGENIGLNGAEVKAMLDSDAFADDVKREISEAQQLGIRGVPFFLLDKKYGVSGAQESAVFLQALTQTFKEMEKTDPSVVEGEICAIDGNC
jgi:predicted DsbA family dithiol-disulfide isomerase